MLEIILVILWITVILLVISGIDDLYLDSLYWLLRGRYKSKFPDFSTMHDYPEKPIAILLGAWNESGVIGRTLSYAVKNLRYKNYRIFVGVYPNDVKTVNVVKELSLKDPRIIACINPQNGPTTKADNLNCLYAGLCDYEKVYGEFEVMLIHDAEDFLHPSSLKLYNFLIGYKGYHGIQIPVIPIKSKHGKLYHRTYCDAFAEIHTKDMIVRQGMGTFMPFSGTGMGFHRKAIYYLEKNNEMKKDGKIKNNPGAPYEYVDQRGRKVEMTEDYFNNTENKKLVPLYYNDTNYSDDPFVSLNKARAEYKRPAQTIIRRYTMTFMFMVALGISLLVYAGNGVPTFTGSNNNSLISKVYAGINNSPDASEKDELNEAGSENINGYIDLKYEAIYYPLQKNKYEVQESVWDSYDEANNRLSFLLSLPFMVDSEGYINKSLSEDRFLYKVMLGKYASMNEARAIVIQIRELLKNNDF